MDGRLFTLALRMGSRKYRRRRGPRRLASPGAQEGAKRPEGVRDVNDPSGARQAADASTLMVGEALGDVSDALTTVSEAYRRRRRASAAASANGSNTARTGTSPVPQPVAQPPPESQPPV